MRKNPERLAWLVLIVSFAMCGLTATVVPATAKQVYENYTSVRPARLDVIQGTVLVRHAGTTIEQGARTGTDIRPGDSIRTAGDARAIVWLFDDSNVELGPDSTVLLRESQSTLFTDRSSSISLHLAGGRQVVNVGLPITAERRFTVTTNLGALALEEGSYDIDLSQPNLAETIIRRGRATVTTVASADTTITCSTGERAELRPGEAPLGPLPLSKNLIQNGAFSLPKSLEQPLGPGWKADERGTEGQKGTVTLVEDAAGNYVRFRREGKGHGENYAVQILERDVSQFRSLRLLLDVRLVNQSLSGGGVAGTEYPFHFRVLYRDARGREWREDVGFYYQNEANYPTTFGLLRPHNEWFVAERDLSHLEPRPAYLIYIELVASGWDYESHLRNVQLIAE